VVASPPAGSLGGGLVDLMVEMIPFTMKKDAVRDAQKHAECLARAEKLISEAKDGDFVLPEAQSCQIVHRGISQNGEDCGRSAVSIVSVLSWKHGHEAFSNALLDLLAKRSGPDGAIVPFDVHCKTHRRTPAGMAMVLTMEDTIRAHLARFQQHKKSKT
jgi:hypothetical protein